MKIGEAAERSGLSTKAIRYYEDIRLIGAGRGGNGYRDYGEREVHELRFVARACALGFTVEECRHLLALYRDRDRSSADVRAAAERHLADIRRKLGELEAMERTLAGLVRACQGDERPDCPILEGLGGG
jgi:MerR family transcriptional regulator, copper efflux regulator